jgi:serine/threonine-protein kinase HipA
MGRKKQTQNLNVFLNSKLIGVLTRKTSGAITFSYDKIWIKNGHAISLSLPLADEIFASEKAAFYFDNLLPDNIKILNAVASKVGANSIQQFDLLSAIGRECVGALMFFPENEKPVLQNKMVVRLLKTSDIAKRLRRISTTNPLGNDDDGDFRLSLAGAQEKMALLLRKDKWFEPKGASATSHILKKSIGQIAGNIDFSLSVDNEWLCLQLSKLAGIKTCSAEILNFEDERVLCIERFDRAWKDNYLHRIQQEDLCQALGFSPLKKYERDGGPTIRQIMDLLSKSNNSEADRKEFFKTVFFNDLIYNTDGHAKNFSIYITKNGFALTPMYDILSAHFLIGNKDRYKKLRSSLSVNKKFIYPEISLKDWQIESKNCGLSADIFYQICDELKLFSKSLIRFSVPKNIDSKHAKLVLDGIRNRAQLLFKL